MHLHNPWLYGRDDALKQIKDILSQMEADFGAELCLFLAARSDLFLEMICECLEVVTDVL